MSQGRAALVEVFHSIQGEGRHVGLPMAFVRVAACPLRCRYCDTPHSYVADSTCRVALGDAERREPNPVTAERAVELALESAVRSRFAAHGRLIVSVTGGEPLLYPEFVLGFGEALGDRGRLHLETAALHPDAMRAVLPVVHHVSADWKLPETLTAGDLRAEHESCVRAIVAHGREITLDVKLVITAEVREQSFVDALERLAPFRERLLLVIQPVTPFGDATTPPRSALLARLASLAASRGYTYRVLPQIHPMLAVE